MIPSPPPSPPPLPPDYARLLKWLRHQEQSALDRHVACLHTVAEPLAESLVVRAAAEAPVLLQPRFDKALQKRPATALSGLAQRYSAAPAILANLGYQHLYSATIQQGLAHTALTLSWRFVIPVGWLQSARKRPLSYPPRSVHSEIDAALDALQRFARPAGPAAGAPATNALTIAVLAFPPARPPHTPFASPAWDGLAPALRAYDDRWRAHWAGKTDGLLVCMDRPQADAAAAGAAAVAWVRLGDCLYRSDQRPANALLADCVLELVRNPQHDVVARLSARLQDGGDRCGIAVDEASARLLGVPLWRLQVCARLLARGRPETYRLYGEGAQQVLLRHGDGRAA